MGLKLEIELNRLSEPDVALAVAHLIEALSGSSAFLPAVAPRTPAARAAVAAAANPPPVLPALDLTPRERFLDFVENLPERSRQFLELVRVKKLLKISDAMKELEIDAPKAMGGLTGSIGRWAPLRGVEVPYEATTADGERAWRWIGGPGSEPEEGETPADAATRGRYLPPVVVLPPVPLSESRRSYYVAKPTPSPYAANPYAEAPAPEAEQSTPEDEAPPYLATEKVTEAAPAQTPEKAPEKAPYAEAAPAPLAAYGAVQTKAPAQVVPTVAPLTDELLDTLPPRSRQFIKLLHERKVLRMADVLAALDLARPRAVGGVTEPVLRAARDLGLPKPFVGGKDADGRVWLLPGVTPPADVELD